MFSLFRRAAARAAKRAHAARLKAAAKALRQLTAAPAKAKLAATAKLAAKAKAATRAERAAKPKLAAKPKPAAGTGGRLARATPAPTPVPTPGLALRGGLGETLRRIKAQGFRPGGAATSPGRDAPPGASFKVKVHDGASGKRSYKLYLPARPRPSARGAPLLVMLHGCTQTPDDFARGAAMNALAEEFGVLVAYPAQPVSANSKRCWNWYDPADQARGGGEPALIAGLTRDILRLHDVDPGRVYLAGLSAGGALAAIVARAYPDIFAAVGVHSGVPAGAARSPASGLLAMRHGAPGLRSRAATPTIVFHGDADPVVHPRNGRYVALRALEAFPPLQATARRARAPGGRGYVRTVHAIGGGKPLCETWVIEGGRHGWSGGSASGSFTDPAGPDASRAMLRFFLRHRTTAKQRRALAPS